MAYYLYSKEELPSGFKYPLSFLEIVSKEDVLDLDPWWFLYEFEDFAKQWLFEIKKQYPTRQLVPFAKTSYSDDIVCFDGSDESGEPKVFFVHAFASPGWEDRGSVSNFDEWLKIAKEESAQYKADRAESE
ncbi:SMI1/KNR4 family protein [Serratia rubidaea]|uniref:SMI1/KNR4 family protein n=1 Tax=Serratia rubidaea TaxID=61652 RepID=UPI00234A7B3D|nr:SMI1/KNR4 family protein [Serratia rubidaea]MCR1000739.1 SMI1/KNR4 family protein [Serratia rubidaea]MDC6118492.1 SMI1/KNR4 family protein [Serratia rubidaea]